MENSVEDKRTGCTDKHGFKIPPQPLISYVTLAMLLNISDSISSSSRTIDLL